MIPTPPRRSRPLAEIDPVTVAIAFLIIALAAAIWSLMEIARRTGVRRRHQRFLSEVNVTLAEHTRLLADELFIAQVELQGELSAELDPEDDFWASLRETGLLGAALAISEGLPKGSGRADLRPCEDCPQ